MEFCLWYQILGRKQPSFNLNEYQLYGSKLPRFNWDRPCRLKNKNVKYKPYKPIKIAPKVIKDVICKLYQCEWQQIIHPVGHKQKAIRAVALALYSKHLGWTYKKTIEVFPGIHANTLWYAIKRAPDIDKDKWKTINRHLISLKR